ncbi:uncharacterized protein LOC136718034 isoform X2 [Amia ocellicauda]|uniref:uncharacterized protein LOC136718034 isoform X2 n=1 Tax=Amia ocellicauda TaxID=2972642 RepID=UPI0034649B30
MAQCHGEIVCKSGASDVTESMGKDDTALVKAYEKAVKTFAESAKAAEGERAVMDGESESDIQSERSDEGRITAQRGERYFEGVQAGLAPLDQHSPVVVHIDSEDCVVGIQVLWHADLPASADASLADVAVPLAESHMPSLPVRRVEDQVAPDPLVLYEAAVAVQAVRVRLQHAGLVLLPGLRTAALGRWQVGSRCRTVWSEDGLMYPAMILSVTGQRCRVEFEDYGNEEEVDIGALLPPDSQELPDSLTHVGTLQAGQGTGTEWQVGSRCRAVWSEDGLIYPAVILSVTGHHCQVEFEGYGNKEELELSALLPLETCKQGAHEDEGNRSNPEPVNIKDKKMTSRREGQEDSCSGKSRSPPFTFFPPMPPGYDCSGAFLHLPPPPPPPAFLSSCGRSDSPAEDEDLGGLSSMLLSWYLCGYHTGCYMALQQARKSQEQSPERAQAKSKPKKHSY